MNAPRQRASSRPAWLEIDGVLLLDKPVGLSSNAAMQRARRALRAAKAGHVGTLDPMAGGLLPLCLGEATKFSGGMFAADKVYVADLNLGVVTDTGDAEGQILSRQAADIAPEALAAVLPRFTGDILQTPPMYSALKRDGKPLYAYARAGQTVAREPRRIVIHGIEILACAGDHAQLRVHCGKGTYIRTLAEDIGAALGCGASLKGLRRTVVGPFDVSAAVSLEALETDPAAARAGLLPPDSLVATLSELTLDEAQARRIATGCSCAVSAMAGGPTFRLYDAGRRFLGLGDVGTDGLLKPRRLVAEKGGAGSPEGAPGA